MATELKLRREAVEWRESEGELLVLDIGASEYLSANATGGRLWQALAGGATREELVGMLVEAFQVDDRTAEADVDAFLAMLRERGLLEDEGALRR
jgi:Coenzyme PQQ synthesis protein D (PqqD)